MGFELEGCLVWCLYWEGYFHFYQVLWTTWDYYMRQVAMLSSVNKEAHCCIFFFALPLFWNNLFFYIFAGNYSPAGLTTDILRVLCDGKECATECLYTNTVIEELLQPLHYLLKGTEVSFIFMQFPIGGRKRGNPTMAVFHLESSQSDGSDITDYIWDTEVKENT